MTPPRHNDTGNTATTPTDSNESDHRDSQGTHRRLNTALYEGATKNVSGVFGVYQDGEDLQLVPLEHLTEQAGVEVLNSGTFLDVLRALLPVVRDHHSDIEPAGLCGIAIGRHLPAKTGNPRAWEYSAVAEDWLHVVWWHPPQRRCSPFYFWSAPGERRSAEAEAAAQILDMLTATAGGPGADAD